MCMMLCFRRRLGAGFLWLISGGLVAVGLLAPWSPAEADSPSGGQLATAETINAALRYEIAGMNFARDRLLRHTLDESPGCTAARWHTGHVRLEGKWVHVDDVPELTQSDSRYQAYLDIRPKYGPTVSEQMQLGKWCRYRRLHENARAHFRVVLALSPNHAEARKQLGYRQVDGEWLTKEEIAIDRERRMAASQWTFTLTSYRRGLRNRSENVQARARARCLAVDDPNAIPAIESVLTKSKESEARLALEMLKNMTAHEDVAGALMRLAVSTDWPEIGDEAAGQLSYHVAEAFVPEMLAMLSTPFEVRSEFRHGARRRHNEADWLTEAEFLRQYDGRWGFVHRRIVWREGRTSIQKEVVDTAYRKPFADAKLEIDAQIAEAKQRVKEQNGPIETTNLRVCSALNIATDQRLPVRAESWWKWWDDRNGTIVVEKPVRQTYREEGLFYLSCFAAGTPVATIDGPKPIERVQVGELVLSQHPDTGELAYKPVIRTTVRQRLQLVRIRAGDDVIDCTGGHLFWVAGSGWTRADELAHCDALHGVAGTTLVDKVETGPFEQVYNLAVDGFHAYFVGQEKLFVHDLTERSPTTAVVPGLTR